jgi:O-antigen/teichoic acid export membrane protein
VLVIPIAHAAIQLIYGPQYISTASLLVVLVWSEVPLFFSQVLNSALIIRIATTFASTSDVGRS